MELYGFMEREKKIPSYFFIITKNRNLLFMKLLFFLISLIPQHKFL